MNSLKSKTSGIAWTVWMIASVFYAYQYILRVMPNIMMENIMQQFNIGAAAFGQFSGIYYIGYSLIHMPIGIMLDRFGPRKVMTGCILFTVIGLLPLVFADHWIYPTAGRLLIGIGSSAAILGVFKIIRMTFSEQQFPRMLSLSVTIGLVGAIYGGGPVSYMLEKLGYESIIYIFAAAGLVLAGITYLIVPNETSTPDTTVMADVKEVLGNHRVVLSCLFAGMMVGPLEGFADVWGTAFLKQAYGMDNTLAASLPSMIFVGMCFGAPILTMIADRIGSYLGTIIGAAIVMAIGFSFLLAVHLSSSLISISFILVGVCCAYQILAIYKASTYVRAQVAGLTTAVANMIIMMFGYAFHTVIGTVVNAFGGPSASQALIYGIAVIPIALVAGAAGYVYLFAMERREARTEATLTLQG